MTALAHATTQGVVVPGQLVLACYATGTKLSVAPAEDVEVVLGRDGTDADIEIGSGTDISARAAVITWERETDIWWIANPPRVGAAEKRPVELTDVTSRRVHIRVDEGGAVPLSPSGIITVRAGETHDVHFRQPHWQTPEPLKAPQTVPSRRDRNSVGRRVTAPPEKSRTKGYRPESQVTADVLAVLTWDARHNGGPYLTHEQAGRVLSLTTDAVNKRIQRYREWLVEERKLPGEDAKKALLPWVCHQLVVNDYDDLRVEEKLYAWHQSQAGLQ